MVLLFYLDLCAALSQDAFLVWLKRLVWCTFALFVDSLLFCRFSALFLVFLLILRNLTGLNETHYDDSVVDPI